MKFPSLKRKTIVEQETEEDYFKRVHGVDLLDVRMSEENDAHMRYIYHPSDEVREQFAMNPNITLFWVFDRLLKQVSKTVRINTIKNPAMDGDLVVAHLERLNPNNPNDQVDFNAAVERVKLIEETIGKPEPQVIACLKSNGYLA